MKTRVVLRLVLVGSGLVMTGVALGVLGGCSGSVESGKSAGEVRYNLSLATDRGSWAPHDLSFAGVVGPYALYKVVGAHPRLDGPTVPGLHGAAHLTAAVSYFTDQAKSAATGTVSLRASGAMVAQAEFAAAASGTCATLGDPFAPTPGEGNTPPSSGGAPPASGGGSGSWGNGCQSSLGDAGTTPDGGAGGWGGAGWGGAGTPGGSGSGGTGGGSGGTGGGYGGTGGGYGGSGDAGGGWAYDGGCQENVPGSGGAMPGAPGTSGGSTTVVDSGIGIDNPVVLSLTIEGPVPMGSVFVVSELSVSQGAVRGADATKRVCCDPMTCTTSDGASVVVP